MAKSAPRFSTVYNSGKFLLEPVQYLNVYGLTSGFFANQGVKPKEYWLYFEAEQRRVAENQPSRQARGDAEQALTLQSETDYGKRSAQRWWNECGQTQGESLAPVMQSSTRKA